MFQKVINTSVLLYIFKELRKDASEPWLILLRFSNSAYVKNLKPTQLHFQLTVLFGYNSRKREALYTKQRRSALFALYFIVIFSI